MTNNIPTDRVTPEMMEDFIQAEFYTTAGEAMKDQADVPSGLGRLTLCFLVLKNGITLVGQSACADPANFNADYGRTIARKHACEQMWPILGFMVRSRLDMVERASPPSKAGFTTHVGQKVIHAKPMIRGDYCDLRGWNVPEDEMADDRGYMVEYADGGDPNIGGYTGYVSWSPKDVFEKAYGSPIRQPVRS